MVGLAYLITRAPGESFQKWINRIFKAEAASVPKPDPLPEPDPIPNLNDPPFGLVEMPLGYAGNVRAENPEPGTRFPECVAYVENTGAIAIKDALLFWQRPDGMIDRVQKISHVEPGEIGRWYNSFLASEESTVGTWTVWLYASSKPDLTLENYIGAPGQLLAKSNFESTRYVK